MSDSGCLDFLANYAEVLNGNPIYTDSGGIPVIGRPHPLFFSGTNCSGTMWFPANTISTPNILDQVQLNDPRDNPEPNTDINSIYIPSFWQIATVSGTTTTFIPKSPQALPFLLSNTSNVPGFQAISTASVFQPTDSTGQPVSDSDWQLGMCLNRISTIVGANFLNTFQQGSSECDAYMDVYCAHVSSFSCAPGSTEAAVLPSKYIPCVCLVEENCIRETFCEDGNTDPKCAAENAAAFQAAIPVTCFGKNCSVEGYRWFRMQNQRCNLTLCEQIISIIGDNIVVKGGSTIWCGNRSIPVTSVTPTPTVSPLPPGAVSLPLWGWVLIGVALFVVFVTVPLAIIVYRRYLKRKDFQQRPPSEVKSGLSEAP